MGLIKHVLNIDIKLSKNNVYLNNFFQVILK